MSYGLVFGALLVVLCLVAFIGGLVWWVRRPISSRRQSSGVLPLFGHDRAAGYARADDNDEDARALLIIARAPSFSAAATGAAAATASSVGGSTASHQADRVPPLGARTASPNWSAPASRMEYAPVPDAPLPDGTEFDGRSIRFSVPTDSTLQCLPGRLEIVGGPDVGREIRFVRTPGRDVIEVTFGRNEGPPYRHVQLHDATVSRTHARMRFRDGQWLLSNCSASNPVLCNGMVVDSNVDRTLAEGDQIEMGEVVFRFHV